MKKIMIKTICAAFAFLITGAAAFAGGSIMLENGITLIEKPRPFTKTVTVALFIKGGLFNETPENNGIGALVSRVWIKSSKILETSEFYGGFISAKPTPYAFEISFSAPTESADKMYKDFEAFLLKPEFDKNIFEREKALLLEELETAKDNPNTQAYNNFNELIFEGTPYALPVEGKPETVSKLTLKDVEKYYKDNFKGASIIVAVAGKYDEAFLKKLKQSLNSIDKGKVKEFKCNDKGVKNRTKENEDSRIQQAKLFIGYNAPAVSSSDYPALKVLTELLGGGMSSRYFTEIRKNSGYAYAVGAAYPSRLCSSRFFASAGLDYNNVESAIEKIEEINKHIGKTITAAEIEKAKNSILGSALMETQTNASVAWNAAFFETMGLGSDYYDKYVETLKKIGPAELKKAAEIFKGPKTVYVLKPKKSEKNK